MRPRRVLVPFILPSAFLIIKKNYADDSIRQAGTVYRIFYRSGTCYYIYSSFKYTDTDTKYSQDPGVSAEKKKNSVAISAILAINKSLILLVFLVSLSLFKLVPTQTLASSESFFKS